MTSLRFFIGLLLLLSAIVHPFRCTSGVRKLTSRLLAKPKTELEPKKKIPKSSKTKSSSIKNKPATVQKTTKQHRSDTSERDAMVAEIVRIMSNYDQTDASDKSETSTSLSIEKEQSDLLNGIVRVYCTHSPPNFAMPWQRLKQEFSTSTGFVIEGKRLLTNAHAVEFGSLIQVKRRESEDKYVASVVAVGHECDLAILTVEDEEFWKSIHPLKIGKVPDLQEEVSVIGYPVGGDSISISSGVVSRIEMQEYAQASAQLLAIQIGPSLPSRLCDLLIQP